MSSATDEFFDKLTAQPQPMLASTSGSLRFDVTSSHTAESWHVSIDRGDVSVKRDPSVADVTVQLSKSLFDDIVQGRANAVAATLRGDIGVEGDVRLLNVFQRVFPGPSEAKAS